MKRKAAKVVPKLFNFEQKQSHVDNAQEKRLATFSDYSDLLKLVTTGDESLVCGCDIETEAQ